MSNDVVKSGIHTSEFWLQLVAHFAPMLMAYVVNALVPDSPAATAAVAAVTAVAGHFSAKSYAEERSALKTDAANAIAQAFAEPPATK